MTGLVLVMIAGAVFGCWSHFVTGSGGWSDYFTRRP